MHHIISFESVKYLSIPNIQHYFKLTKHIILIEEQRGTKISSRQDVKSTQLSQQNIDIIISSNVKAEKTSSGYADILICSLSNSLFISHFPKKQK